MIGVERVDFIGVPARDPRGRRVVLRRHARARAGPDSWDHWIKFETTNVTLALVRRRRTRAGRALPGARADRVRVDNLNGERGRLEEAGVEFKTDDLDSGVCFGAPSSWIRTATG